MRALRDLGFELTEGEAAEVRRGKDFVQLRNGPFDVDLVFAPDGIETFAEAWRRRVEVEGFPVCHPDDIIASKRAANRAKDRESLPRLLAFRDYWLQRRQLRSRKRRTYASGSGGQARLEDLLAEERGQEPDCQFGGAVLGVEHRVHLDELGRDDLPVSASISMARWASR